MDFFKILKTASRGGASDILLKVGSYPRFRFDGKLVDLADGQPISLELMNHWITNELSKEVSEKYQSGEDVDFAIVGSDGKRYRANLFKQRGNPGLVIRVISSAIASIEELQLPSAIANIVGLKRGLVLITGATGSGKSTTLAAIIQKINETRETHVITVEDPIEFSFVDIKSTVNQREVGSDVESFSSALRSALRQNPDIIYVGELRDKETTEMALMAAETGHLVLSTLHTSNSIETFTRIMGYFEPHLHQNLRIMLANTINTVVSQRLVSKRNNEGLIAAHEILINNSYIKDLILKGEDFEKVHEAIIKDNAGTGMMSFDQSLLKLYRKNQISSREALKHASNAPDLKLHLQGVS